MVKVSLYISLNWYTEENGYLNPGSLGFELMLCTEMPALPRLGDSVALAAGAEFKVENMVWFQKKDGSWEIVVYLTDWKEDRREVVEKAFEDLSKAGWVSADGWD